MPAPMPVPTADDLALLAATPLFHGMDEAQIRSLLPRVGARRRRYERDELVLRAGQVTRAFGLVLHGSVLIQSTDAWGNATLLSRVEAGGAFAEVYACLSNEPLFVDVVAQADTEVLFIDARQVLHPYDPKLGQPGSDARNHAADVTSTGACSAHRQLADNLLLALARQSLMLARRSVHVAPKTIRGKVLAYLSDQARSAGASTFDIPLDRQQLANYLGVDRSALSAELSRMRKAGLIEFRRSRFTLLGT